MNSIKAISINSLNNDDKSQSTSSINNMWKIEKYTDPSGKLNYKIRTDKAKSKSKMSVSSAMPAFGVPGAKSYQTKNTPTLNSSIIKYSPIKSHKSKKNTSIKIPTISQSVSIATKPTIEVIPNSIKSNIVSKSSEVVSEIVSNVFNGGWLTFERNYNGILSTSLSYLVDQNGYISYLNEKELSQKSFLKGHLFLHPFFLKYVTFLIYSDGWIPAEFQISIWSQRIDKPYEIQNIYNYKIKEEIINNQLFQKAIVKSVDIYVSPNCQLFVTLHFSNQPKQNHSFGIKYSLSYQLDTKKESLETISELNLNVLQSKINNDKSLPQTIVSPMSSSSESSKELEKVSIFNPNNTDIPNLSNTIFGNISLKKSNIPIFQKTKDKSVYQDTFSLLQSSNTLLQPLKMTEESSAIPFDDSSNQTENDLKNILDILKDLKH